MTSTAYMSQFFFGFNEIYFGFAFFYILYGFAVSNVLLRSPQTRTDRNLPLQQVKHMFTMRERKTIKLIITISYQEHKLRFERKSKRGHSK